MSLHALPEELLISIFEHLDEEPPSHRKARLEPSLELTTSDDENLKNISKVSRRFRRIVLPLLFRFSRIRLNVVHLACEAEWAQCLACGDLERLDCSQLQQEQSNQLYVDPHHLDLFQTAREDTVNSAAIINTGASANLARGADFKLSSLRWTARIHHATKDFLSFLQAENLARHVHSFVFMTNHMMERSQSRFPHRLAASSDHRYRAAAELWHQLFTTIPALRRCVIVGPPADLACLTNCAIDLFGDWAFEGMDHHILELALDLPETAKIAEWSLKHSDDHAPVESPEIKDVSFVPSEYPGIAASSVLKLRPWAHLSLNEGSFLRAYGTYEYFERGPPSLIYSIKDCLSSNRRAWRPNSQGGMDLSSLKSFTYTAILPFANHCDFRGLLPYIDELDVKLAPDPTSDILNEKSRVGRAELGDCWQEFIDAYRAITRPFQTFAIRPDGTPKLKRFVCRDMNTRALVDDLNEEFVPLCLPIWAEMEPGVFKRQQSSLPIYSSAIV